MKIVDPNPYGVIDQKRLSEFESLIGSTLPASYRKYLLKYNGGEWLGNEFTVSPEEGQTILHHVYGIHDGPEYSRLDKNFEKFKGRIPQGVVPIASDMAGNQICLGISDHRKGLVYFWDHEKCSSSIADLIVVSKSFEGFVSSLKEMESNSDSLDRIIGEGDISTLCWLLDTGNLNIEDEDENGRTLIERATIKAQSELIKTLFKRGAKLRNSLALAELNAQFFDKHKEIVKLIERLDSEEVGRDD